MSDWQRVIDNCVMAGLDAPENMFDVSECIDKQHDINLNLISENKKLYSALNDLLKACDDEGWCNDKGKDWEEQATARKLIETIKTYE